MTKDWMCEMTEEQYRTEWGRMYKEKGEQTSGLGKEKNGEGVKRGEKSRRGGGGKMSRSRWSERMKADSG